MQMKIARHGPMIRSIGLNDRRLRSRQPFRKYEVKGRVWKAMSAWVSYALRQGQFFKPALISSTYERIECLFRREHFLIVIRVEITPDHNAFDH